MSEVKAGGRASLCASVTVAGQRRTSYSGHRLSLLCATHPGVWRTFTWHLIVVSNISDIELFIKDNRNEFGYADIPDTSKPACPGERTEPFGR
jgi:hypothetical protein